MVITIVIRYPGMPGGTQNPIEIHNWQAPKSLSENTPPLLTLCTRSQEERAIRIEERTSSMTVVSTVMSSILFASFRIVDYVTHSCSFLFMTSSLFQKVHVWRQVWTSRVHYSLTYKSTSAQWLADASVFTWFTAPKIQAILIFFSSKKKTKKDVFKLR